MCRLFARNNNYPKNLWTVLGFFFGIWAVIALAFHHFLISTVLCKINHFKYIPVVAVFEVAGEAISRFGVMDAEEVEKGVYKVRDMVEKPPFSEAPSDLAIIGRYVLTPDIFDALEKTRPGAIGEIQITDAMRSLLKKRPFYAVRFEGTRYDAGDKLGFLIATVEFALKHEELASEFRDYLRTLKLKSK